MKQPLLMVDITLFTMINGKINIALITRKNENEPFYNTLSLLGGYVHLNIDNNLEDTARRVLKDKAQISEHIYLEQLATFSGPHRDPRGWSASTVYLVIAPYEYLSHSQDIIFIPIDSIELDTLPFDHKDITLAAIQRINSKTKYSTLPIYLMKEHFTLSELRNTYEQLLGGEIDQRGFNRKILLSEAVRDTGLKTNNANRPATIYEANRDKLIQFDFEIKLKYS